MGDGRDAEGAAGDGRVGVGLVRRSLFLRKVQVISLVISLLFTVLALLFPPLLSSFRLSTNRLRLVPRSGTDPQCGVTVFGRLQDLTK